ncbi:ATP-grasp domain-containing protein [Azospirillum doebereinerae]|uniref:ATP-grasp domain-containing protein n=1 Tax=Azospirillum doebereinerae TaxID=92933 RepID=UPI001EE5AEAF|nr:ATP-grasp domain-containing protein [Azospirillum doebereinerae]MCG5239376.1 ATP-grasp domain-containing protein [Azospirillum doebereinerae]
MPDECQTVAQEFIPGRSASVSFSALKGQMLEAFSYSALQHQPAPFGPASVIEVIDHPGLLKVAERMVELAEYSGFGGIDAILPEDGSEPVFLEFNARPTQTTHLGKVVGADLCQALVCALSSQPYEGRRDRREQMRIALFPNELIRDHKSRYLIQAHHDVPWNERRVADAIISSTPELHLA